MLGNQVAAKGLWGNFHPMYYFLIGAICCGPPACLSALRQDYNYKQRSSISIETHHVVSLTHPNELCTPQRKGTFFPLKKGVHVEIYVHFSAFTQHLIGIC